MTRDFSLSRVLKHTCIHTHTHTCKNNQAVAGLRVAEDAASQQHVLVGQGVFLVSPVQSPAESVQLVVGRLAHHLALTHRHMHTCYTEGMNE